jgi:hypothetical protein
VGFELGVGRRLDHGSSFPERGGDSHAATLWTLVRLTAPAISCSVTRA